MFLEEKLFGIALNNYDKIKLTEKLVSCAARDYLEKVDGRKNRNIIISQLKRVNNTFKKVIAKINIDQNMNIPEEAYIEIVFYNKSDKLKNEIRELIN